MNIVEYLLIQFKTREPQSSDRLTTVYNSLAITCTCIHKLLSENINTKLTYSTTDIIKEINWKGEEEKKSTSIPQLT
jgi:hypothetical protein